MDSVDEIVTDTLYLDSHLMPYNYACLNLFKGVISVSCLNKHQYKHPSLLAILKLRMAHVF